MDVQSQKLTQGTFKRTHRYLQVSQERETHYESYPFQRKKALRTDC